MAVTLSAEGNFCPVKEVTDMTDNYVNQVKETIEQSGRVTNEAMREMC